MAGDVSVGIISGTFELDDRFSDPLASIEAKIEALGNTVAGSTASMITGFFGVEAAIAAVKAAGEVMLDVLKDIVFEGSKAEGIETTFESLEKGANLGYDALQKLRDATRGQVTDFELMKIENKDIAAGLKFTADQTTLLGQASLSLSKAQGIDLADAMEKVNQALLTGRARSLQSLIGRIDQVAAEEKFAASLGTTVSQLSAEGKVEAIRLEIFSRLATVTDRVGEAHLTLADRIQQAQVWLSNFEEKVEVGINRSPVLEQGIRALDMILKQTFGGDNSALIDKTIKKIEDIAISIVGFGQTAIGVVKGFISGWMLLDNLWNHIAAGWDAIVYSFEAGAQLVLMALDKITPGTAFKGAIDALEKDMDGLYNKMAEREKQVEDNAKTEATWDAALDKVGKTIGIVQNAMQTARDGEKDAIDVHQKNADIIQKVGKALDDNSKYLKDNSLNVAANKKEIEAAAAAWEAYDTLVAKRAGDSFDAQRQAITQWEQDQISKLDLTTTAWSKHYAAIEATAKEKLDQIGLETSKLYDGSRQKLQDNLDSATKTYEEALSHASDYNRDFLDKLHDAVFAARDAFMDYGNTAVAANKKAADSVDMVTQSLKDAIAAEDKLNAEMSHSVEYDLSTPGGIGFFLSNNTGAAIHATVEQIEQLIKAGYNLQQLIQNGVVTLPGTQSYANTSVQDLLNNKGAGGTASSTTTSHPVVTNGASPLATSSNSVNIQGGLAFNISNPDPRAVATEVSKVLMNTAFLGRQWPQASR